MLPWQYGSAVWPGLCLRPVWRVWQQSYTPSVVTALPVSALNGGKAYMCVCVCVTE